MSSHWATTHGIALVLSYKEMDEIVETYCQKYPNTNAKQMITFLMRGENLGYMHFSQSMLWIRQKHLSKIRIQPMRIWCRNSKIN